MFLSTSVVSSILPAGQSSQPSCDSVGPLPPSQTPTPEHWVEESSRHPYCGPKSAEFAEALGLREPLLGAAIAACEQLTTPGRTYMQHLQRLHLQPAMLAQARASLRSSGGVTVTHRDGHRTVETADGTVTATLPLPDVLPPALQPDAATGAARRCASASCWRAASRATRRARGSSSAPASAPPPCDLHACARHNATRKARIRTMRLVIRMWLGIRRHRRHLIR